MADIKAMPLFMRVGGACLSCHSMFLYLTSSSNHELVSGVIILSDRPEFFTALLRLMSVSHGHAMASCVCQPGGLQADFAMALWILNN